MKDELQIIRDKLYNKTVEITKNDSGNIDHWWNMSRKLILAITQSVKEMDNFIKGT